MSCTVLEPPADYPTLDLAVTGAFFGLNEPDGCSLDFGCDMVCSWDTFANDPVLDLGPDVVDVTLEEEIDWEQELAGFELECF